MDVSSRLKDAFRRRASRVALNAAREWFEDNVERLNQLAGNEHLRRYIFEPFNELIDSFGKTTEGQVKATITQVAIANAVLAGLPGKLGVGVAVSMGLEAWMAYRIASHVGIRIEKPGDIFKYLGMAAGVVAISCLVSFTSCAGYLAYYPPYRSISSRQLSRNCWQRISLGYCSGWFLRPCSVAVLLVNDSRSGCCQKYSGRPRLSLRINGKHSNRH